MNGHKDVCIKRGSFCPVCKGVGGEDCWHEASEFQSGSFKYDRLERELAEARAALATRTDSPTDAVELLRRALDAGYEWVVEAANESKGEGDIVFINAMRDIKLIERALASLTPSQSDPIEYCGEA